LKDLRVGITKDVVLRSAPQIVDRELNAMDQLKKINTLINGELDYIEKTSRQQRDKSARNSRSKD